VPRPVLRQRQKRFSRIQASSFPLLSRYFSLQKPEICGMNAFPCRGDQASSETVKAGFLVIHSPMQCPHDRLRLPVDHLKQNPRRSFGMTDALLPVAYCSGTQAKQSGKPVLRQSQFLPQMGDIDIRNFYLM